MPKYFRTVAHRCQSPAHACQVPFSSHHVRIKFVPASNFGSTSPHKYELGTNMVRRRYEHDAKETGRETASISRHQRLPAVSS